MKRETLSRWGQSLSLLLWNLGAGIAPIAKLGLQGCQISSVDCLLALLGDALLVGDEGCETAIGERVLEQTEDSLERAGGYVSTDAHTVDDVLGVTDASG